MRGWWCRCFALAAVGFFLLGAVGQVAGQLPPPPPSCPAGTIGVYPACLPPPPPPPPPSASAAGGGGGGGIATVGPYRFGTLTWAPTATTFEALFESHQAYQIRDWFQTPFPPTVGMKYLAGTFDFGDGATDDANLVVTQVEENQDWFRADLVDRVGDPLRHTYASANNAGKPWVASWEAADRFTPVYPKVHVNNDNKQMRLQSTVAFGVASGGPISGTLGPLGNAAPVSNAYMVQRCVYSTVCTFPIAFQDPNPGDVVTYRLADPAEVEPSGAYVQPGPPFVAQPAAITPQGIVTWDLTVPIVLVSNEEHYYSMAVVATDGRVESTVDFLVCVMAPGNDQQCDEAFPFEQCTPQTLGPCRNGSDPVMVPPDPDRPVPPGPCIVAAHNQSLGQGGQLAICVPPCQEDRDIVATSSNYTRPGDVPPGDEPTLPTGHAGCECQPGLGNLPLNCCPDWALDSTIPEAQAHIERRCRAEPKNPPRAGPSIKPICACAPRQQAGSVNPANGEFIAHYEPMTVNEGIGPDLRFGVTHRTLDPFATHGALGHRWDLDYGRHLQLRSDGIVRYMGDGRAFLYPIDGEGGFKSPPGFFDRIVPGTAGYTLLEAHGRKDLYDLDGRLVAVLDANGNNVTLAYDANNRLATVTDAIGRSLDVAYGAGNRIANVTDFANRTAHFRYDVAGNLRSIVLYTNESAWATNATGVQVPIWPPRGAYWTNFTYDAGHRMLTVGDSNGANYIQNTFDPIFKTVSRQDMGTDSWFTYSYLPQYDPPHGKVPMKTTIEDATEAHTELDYVSEEIRYVKTKTEWVKSPGDRSQAQGEPLPGCTYSLLANTTLCIQKTRYAYDSEFNTAKVTMPRGNLVTRIYDDHNPNNLARGNLLFEIRDANGTVDPAALDATQFIIKRYTYDPTYNLVQTEAEERGTDPLYVPPNGGPNSPERYATTNTYDARGNLLNIAYPLVNRYGLPYPGFSPQYAEQPKAQSYTYNAFGQVLQDVAPDGTTTTFRYDENGYLENKTTIGPGVAENVTIENDELGQPTSIRDANGGTYELLSDWRCNLLEVSGPEETEPGLLNIGQPATAKAPPSHAKFNYDRNDQLVGTSILEDGPTLGGKYLGLNDPRIRFVGGANYAQSTNERDGMGRVTKENRSVDQYSRELFWNTDHDGRFIKPAVSVGSEHDMRGNPVGEASDGAFDEYGYDSRNREVNHTRYTVSPSNVRTIVSKTESWYDGNDNLLLRRDELGRDTIFLYDGFDRLTRMIDVNGTHHLTKYDAASHVIETRTVRDVPDSGLPSPLNETVNGLLTADLWERTTYEFDERGQQYAVGRAYFDLATGANLQDGPLRPGDGLVTSLTEYDVKGRVVRTVNDNVHWQARQYDGKDRVILETDSFGNGIEHQFDRNGNEVNRIEIDAQDGGLPTIRAYNNTYDAANNLVKVRDPMGHVTTYGYDSKGRRVHTFDRLGHPSREIYDASNRLIAARYVKGWATEWHNYTYVSTDPVPDPEGNYTHTWHADVDNAQAPSNDFEAIGPFATADQELGEGWVAGDWTESDLAVVTQDYEFALAVLDKWSDVSIERVERWFAPRTLPTSEWTPGWTGGAEPLPAPRPASGTLPSRNATYDWHHKTSVLLKAPDRIYTRSEYDAHDRFTSGMDGLGHETISSWDGLGRLKGTRDALERWTNYTYDAQDRIATILDPRGATVANTYDEKGRLVQVDVTKGTSGVVGATRQVFEYDFLDNLRRTQEYEGTSQLHGKRWTYDSLGRVLTEKMDYLQATISARDGVGNRLQVLYQENGMLYTTTYDALERPKEIKDAAGNLLARYSYMGQGLVTKRESGNGIVQDYTYDQNRALTGTKIQGNMLSNVVIGSWTFTRDNESRKLTSQDHVLSAWTETYDLDKVGRLAGHQRTGFAEEWILDDANNWEEVETTTTSTATETRTHNANNELTARGSTTLTYDLAGNLVSDGTHAYKWDFKNRLREVRWTSNNTLLASYGYDTDYHRLAKTVNGQSTLYMMDGDREVLEYTTLAPGTSKTYVYGVYVDEIVAMQTSLPVPRTDDPDGFAMEVIGDASATVDDLAVWLNGFAACQAGLAPPCPEEESVARFLQGLAQPQSVGTTYFHQDDLYSTRLLTNVLGQVTDRYAYDPYGRAYHLVGSSAETRLFTGRNKDAETGLYYYRSRYYSPVLGRFVNRDTIGVWGDAKNLGNGFAYTSNMPLINVDPSGKEYTHYQYCDTRTGSGCINCGEINCCKNDGSGHESCSRCDSRYWGCEFIYESTKAVTPAAEKHSPCPPGEVRDSSGDCKVQRVVAGEDPCFGRKRTSRACEAFLESQKARQWCQWGKDANGNCKSDGEWLLESLEKSFGPESAIGSCAISAANGAYQEFVAETASNHGAPMPSETVPSLGQDPELKNEACDTVGRVGGTLGAIFWQLYNCARRMC